ncbi:hypothetical protein [Slackia heliotrinireducens]|uniref:hypothetical protein n=1 Tax=Slackia heliotrinireducens TaxID=84110 RepID=UPI003B5A3E18
MRVDRTAGGNALHPGRNFVWLLQQDKPPFQDGHPKSCRQEISGKWHHFDSKGYMQTGRL